MIFAALLRLLVLGLVLLLLVRLFRASRRRTNRSNWMRARLRRKPSSGQTLQLHQCPVCQHYLSDDSQPCERTDCPRRRGGGAAAVILLALLLGAHPAKADAGGRYLIQVDGQNAVVSLYINDIPAERWTLDKPGSAGASFNHWLRQGGNTIRLAVTALHPDKPATLQAHAWFLGLGSTPGMNIVDILRQDALPTGDGVTVPFNVPSAPALALWTAETTPPDQAAILNKVADFGAALATALKTGHSPQMMDILAFERQDIARAYGGAVTSQQLEISSEQRQDKIEMTTLPIGSDLLIEPIRQSGMVRVSRSSGSPLFAAKAGGRDVFVQALLLGRIAGEWRVLRRSY